MTTGLWSTAGFLRTVVQGGLIAGVLDLAAAVGVNAFKGIAPLSILQSIATGLLGRAAYDGGIATAALGVALHFTIMLVICAIFVAASRRMAFLTQRAVTAGVLYGVAVYLVMNFVVLPLSAFPHPIAPSLASVATNVVIQVLCVGLPIALVSRSGARRIAAV